MRKYIALFFSVSIFIVSCKDNKATGEVIARDQMISLLTDLHIVDGGMYSVSQNPDSLYKYGTDRYLSLFRRHHTDSVQFINSYKYYATKPDELQAMYEKVQDNLKQKTDSLNKISQKNALPPK